MELTTTTEHVKVFPVLDDAVEWIEDEILGETLKHAAELPPLEVFELEIFKNQKEDALVDLVECIERRSLAKDEKLFSLGDPANELYMIRKGAVRITLPIEGTAHGHHTLTYGRGDFFGGIAFIAGTSRFNDAAAMEDTQLFVLRREQFERLKDERKRLAFDLLEGVTKVLALRLRYADKELLAMQD